MASRKMTKRADTPPLIGTSASAETASDSIAVRRNRVMASAGTVMSGGSHDSTLEASATSRAGIRCASLASSMAAPATGPA